jgi:acetyl-CoA synthetase
MRDLSSLRLLGPVGGRQPEGVALVSQGDWGERCPIVDTWWQTETGAI